MVHRFQPPLARVDQLVVEEIGDEVLVYDQRSDQAHCLGPTAASVWRACDGGAGIKQIAAKLGLDRDVVSHAIDELDECRLLDGPGTAGLTRREATRKLAKLGTAAVAAPLIYSIVAPSPALAASEAFCTAAHKCSSTDICSSCPSGCTCCMVEKSNGNMFWTCVAACSFCSNSTLGCFTGSEKSTACPTT